MGKKYNTYSDEELIKLFYKNKYESAVFSVLYDRYKSLVMSYAKSILTDKDKAEDIFQETYIRFYKALKRNKKIPNIAGLLITICRNLCYNEKRNIKNNIPVEESHLFESDYLSFENRELMELINLNMQYLDEKYRTAFILREFDGLPYKEIAEIENISTANAKLRVIRAKKQLIKILQPYVSDIENG